MTILEQGLEHMPACDNAIKQVDGGLQLSGIFVQCSGLFKAKHLLLLPP